MRRFLMAGRSARTGSGGGSDLEERFPKAVDGPHCHHHQASANHDRTNDDDDDDDGANSLCQADSVWEELDPSTLDTAELSLGPKEMALWAILDGGGSRELSPTSEADGRIREAGGTFNNEEDEPSPTIKLPPEVWNTVLDLLAGEGDLADLDFSEWLGRLSALLGPLQDLDPLLRSSLNPASYVLDSKVEAPTPAATPPYSFSSDDWDDGEQDGADFPLGQHERSGTGTSSP